MSGVFGVVEAGLKGLALAEKAAGGLGGAAGDMKPKSRAARSPSAKKAAASSAARRGPPFFSCLPAVIGVERAFCISAAFDVV